MLESTDEPAHGHANQEPSAKAIKKQCRHSRACAHPEVQSFCLKAWYKVELCGALESPELPSLQVSDYRIIRALTNHGRVDRDQQDHRYHVSDSLCGFLEKTVDGLRTEKSENTSLGRGSFSNYVTYPSVSEKVSLMQKIGI
jgi:hypothetical protein